MKKKIYPVLKISFLALLSFSAIACGSKSNNGSTPSIKENSRNITKKAVNNYANIAPEKLLKQVQAHYDLDEYEIAKDKLTYLTKHTSANVNDSTLKVLQVKIDTKLAAIQKEKRKQDKFKQNKRLANSLNNMRIENKGKTVYYYDKKSPEFETKECFYPYVKVDKYGPKLYFKIRFIDSQPLNIQEYIVNVDKLDYTIQGNVEKSITKGKKKYNVELLNKEIKTTEEIEKLQAIANGKIVEAIYVGNHGYKKRKINDEQKISIRNVLDAYTFLKHKN